MTDAKIIIGLTGNIATGKSVVRRMLANSGALGIDADDISHRMLYPGAPAYQPVIDAFGDQILSSRGQILRGKLAEIVFEDEEKLRQLENLIHPWVTKVIEKRIQMAPASLIIIEAIKLFESDLINICDYIWVSHASEDHQLTRIQQTRHMSQEQAMARISAQPSQSEKVANADTVINTEGTFKNTWKQVQKALTRLNDTIQEDILSASLNVNNSIGWHIGSVRQLRDKEWMENWKSLTNFTSQEIFQRLGAQLILPLVQNMRPQSLIFWDNLDFTATMSTVFPTLMNEARTSFVFDAFQCHALYNQCEVLFLPNRFIESRDINPEDFGYAKRLIADLSYPSWQTAAKKGTLENQNEIWAKVIARPIETLDHLTEHSSM
ncbi:MAG: dephospho-CoA kinase [Chloroflexota bacterium]|jgi:dephospho-CoA kinase|nr:dephospho-CoA kinase [Chloroflexota bacterium]